MKITKFEHACFTVEDNDEILVVDPGAYTTDFIAPENVVGIIITHEHPDHLDTAKLRMVIDKNPEAIIIAHEDIVSQLQDFKTKSVVANEGVKVGNFELEFCGGEHAQIKADWPTIANLGVMINERLYYPGDSFSKPERDVEILALPVAAPWMKFSEAADFLTEIKPKVAFPTHDAILSAAGKQLADTMMSGVAEQLGTTYHRIDNEPFEA